MRRSREIGRGDERGLVGEKEEEKMMKSSNVLARFPFTPFVRKGLGTTLVQSQQ